METSFERNYSLVTGLELLFEFMETSFERNDISGNASQMEVEMDAGMYIKDQATRASSDAVKQ